MVDLSIVIVNYNARHFLQICLDALQSALRGINAETIIIDNQSTDDSVSYIKTHYPWVIFIENPENDGFGKANNLGFSLAKGKYILILNPDTIVQQNTLLRSLRMLKEDPKAGAVGVRMLDGSGYFLPESKRGLPTPKVAFFKAFGFARLFPRSKYFARYYVGNIRADRVSEVEVLAGAYMMVKKEVLDRCGGFDEDFFMYGEDIDLSYRITQLGYKNIYDGKVPIIHFKGESAGRDAVWAKHFYGAMHLFSEKHFSSGGRFFNTTINAGIRLRKKLSMRKKTEAKTSELIKLNLVVLSNKKQKLEGQFYHQFKSVMHQKPGEFIDLKANALLFMPDVDNSFMIKNIKKYRGKMQYFFAAADGSFVMTSPNSVLQGELFEVC